MSFDDPRRDMEPQAEPPSVVLTNLPESFEDRFEQVSGHANTVVHDAKTEVRQRRLIGFKRRRSRSFGVNLIAFERIFVST